MFGSTVSEVARQLGARPRDISDLFYRRELADEKCPIVGGKRLIPADYVAVIASALRKHGLTQGPPTTPTAADRGVGAGGSPHRGPAQVIR